MNAEIQERKARLVFQLHQLCRNPPPEIASASVQVTRQWLHRLKTARQIKGSTRASERDLRWAIESMSQPAEMAE